MVYKIFVKESLKIILKKFDVKIYGDFVMINWVLIYYKLCEDLVYKN